MVAWLAAGTSPPVLETTPIIRLSASSLLLGVVETVVGSAGNCDAQSGKETVLPYGPDPQINKKQGGLTPSKLLGSDVGVRHHYRGDVEW